MNTVTFKNGELSIIKNFLNGIKVRGKASRGRSKLLKLLAKKEQELNDDLNDVRKPYLTGRSLVNGTDVVRFDARLSSTGGTTTINTYVNDQELYEKNRREVRKDMNDFRQYVFDQEDELFDDVKTDESDTTATE